VTGAPVSSSPGPVAVPKRVPTDITADLGRDACRPDVALLDLLLAIRLPCNRIGEQPPVRCRERPLPVLNESFREHRIERNAVPRVLGLHIPDPTMDNAPLNQERQRLKIEVSHFRATISLTRSPRQPATRTIVR
jgi:hypothetical protein